ncbi:MAG: 2-oxoacid:acceptor oxidoreductase subunit alpha [Elusimicrobiota bacterium]
MKKPRKIRKEEHIVEIVSDAGEGAQKAAVAFAQTCARMGNGLWTVEIIPSEIQPPPHTTGSASGNRIRLSEKPLVTNAGDKANLVLAFNEMAFLSRIEANSVADDVILVIDSMWAEHDDPEIRKNYAQITEDVRQKGGTVLEIPFEKETLKIVEDPRRGKNMFAYGFLCALYCRDKEVMLEVVKTTFGKKSQKVIDTNVALADKGYQYGEEHLEYQFEILAKPSDKQMVAMNGNLAIALGAIAAGYEMCSMYPITPATSASHFLSDIFEDLGGFVHQAEDEIAAIGVAIGASYAGKAAITITSGPGMALKTEFQGLAVMTETPLVIVDVQRGGPSTGLPTKIEQGDLLSSIFGTPGDAPKVVLAASNIEDCFYILATARKISEEFRTLVIVLTDANLATGQQIFQRPELSEATLPPPMDLNPVPKGTLPFDWDEKTGLSRRLIPGQANGMSVITTLNHAKDGKACYDYESNQHGHRMRSRKLATLQKTLKTPPIYGPDEGDLLIVGWGSTRGAIEEAVDRAQAEGYHVSSMNIQFLNPLPSGLKQAFSRFDKVMTIELNYSDDADDPEITAENRRYSQLCLLLRANTLMDIDTWSRVPGRPFMPFELTEVIRHELGEPRKPGEERKKKPKQTAVRGAK